MAMPFILALFFFIFFFKSESRDNNSLCCLSFIAADKSALQSNANNQRLLLAICSMTHQLRHANMFWDGHHTKSACTAPFRVSHINFKVQAEQCGPSFYLVMWDCSVPAHRDAGQSPIKGRKHCYILTNIWLPQVIELLFNGMKVFSLTQFSLTAVDRWMNFTFWAVITWFSRYGQ